MNKHTIGLIGVMIGIGILSYVVAATAYANPSMFAVGVTTKSAASSSPAYMTPGTGTSTTPIYDAYAQTSRGGTQTKTDSAGMLVIFCGSSTTAVLANQIEYSQDKIDWYRNYVLDITQSSTTSAPYVINSPYAQSWKFASSTVGGAAGYSTCSTAASVFPTPFRYVRVVSSITGANGSVWVQIVPIKQQ